MTEKPVERRRISRRRFIAAAGGAAGSAALGANAVGPFFLRHVSAQDQREITIAFDSPQFWKDQAAAFTEATGIKVNYEDVPFPQLHDRYLAAFVGGSSDYDVVHLRDDWVAEFGSKGFLEPITDRITPEMREEFIPNGFDYLSYDGQVYGVPRYLWLWQFYFNTDFVQEAPKTWDDVLTLAEQHTGDGTYGYIMTLGSTLSINHFTIHLRARGGELFDGRQPTFNTPEGREALQEMLAFIEKEVTDPASFELTATGNTMDIFNQGSIAMMLNTPQVFASANDPEKSKIVGKVKVALVPGATLPSASYSETGAIGIPAASKNKDLAWEFVKFVTTAEQQKQMALVLGRIPARPDVLNDPEVLEKYPNFQVVAEQSQYKMGMSVTLPESSEVNRVLSNELVAALRGSKSVEDALADAEEGVRRIVGE